MIAMKREIFRGRTDTLVVRVSPMHADASQEEEKGTHAEGNWNRAFSAVPSWIVVRRHRAGSRCTDTEH
jgi:hypothetical protein